MLSELSASCWYPNGTFANSGQRLRSMSRLSVPKAFNGAQTHTDCCVPTSYHSTFATRPRYIFPSSSDWAGSGSQGGCSIRRRGQDGPAGQQRVARVLVSGGARAAHGREESGETVNPAPFTCCGEVSPQSFVIRSCTVLYFRSTLFTRFCRFRSFCL